MKTTLEQQLQRMGQNYRRIQAGPYLAKRVMAQAGQSRPGRHWRWLSVGGATVGAVVIAMTLFAIRSHEAGPEPSRLATSLPAIPTWTIRTPDSPKSKLKMPSLSQLGNLPVLPQTPENKTTDQTHTDRKIT